jgi:hypothetical protein
MTPARPDRSQDLVVLRRRARNASTRDEERARREWVDTVTQMGSSQSARRAGCLVWARRAGCQASPWAPALAPRTARKAAPAAQAYRQLGRLRPRGSQQSGQEPPVVREPVAGRTARAPWIPQRRARRRHTVARCGRCTPRRQRRHSCRHRTDGRPHPQSQSSPPAPSRSGPHPPLHAPARWPARRRPPARRTAAAWRTRRRSRTAGDRVTRSH